MKLSPEEIKKVAYLARFNLSPAEVRRYQVELSEVVDYNARKLAQIKKAVKTDLLTSPDLGQADNPRPSLPVDEAISNAPESRNGLFVVPKVLEK